MFPIVSSARLVFQDLYYVSVKALYTVGYSTSLVSLTMAMVILCRFRSEPRTLNFIDKILVFTDITTIPFLFILTCAGSSTAPGISST